MTTDLQGLQHTPATLGVNQGPIVWLNRTPYTGSGVTLAAGGIIALHTVTEPESDDPITNPTTAQWLITQPLSLADARRLTFALGHATASDGKQATVNVFLIEEMRRALNNQDDDPRVEYLKRPWLELTLTAGTNYVPTDSEVINDPSGAKPIISYADTIAVDKDYTPGTTAQICADAGHPTDAIANAASELWMDGAGTYRLAIAIKPGTGVGVWVGLRGS